MRISDIETIRGDRQNQKPFVAYGADTTYDAPEPYGEEQRETVTFVGLTTEERGFILDLVEQRHKSLCVNLRHQQMKPTSAGRTRYQIEFCKTIIAKLKTQIPSMSGIWHDAVERHRKDPAMTTRKDE